MLGVLCKQSIYFLDVVGLGKLNGRVPLVELDTAVNGNFHLVTLNEKNVGSYYKIRTMLYIGTAAFGTPGRSVSTWLILY